MLGGRVLRPVLVALSKDAQERHGRVESGSELDGGDGEEKEEGGDKRGGGE